MSHVREHLHPEQQVPFNGPRLCINLQAQSSMQKVKRRELLDINPSVQAAQYCLFYLAAALKRLRTEPGVFLALQPFPREIQGSFL